MAGSCRQTILGQIVDLVRAYTGTDGGWDQINWPALWQLDSGQRLPHADHECVVLGAFAMSGGGEKQLMS